MVLLALDPRVPSSAEFENALQRIRPLLSETQLEMLNAHYQAPGCMITATELARAAGSEDYSTANLHYGKLGTLIGEQTGYIPGQQSTSFCAFFDNLGDEWVWLLRAEVIKALARLDWFPERTRTRRPPSKRKVQPQS